jgi:hypothetical protein
MESVAVDGLREGKIYSGFAKLARRDRLKDGWGPTIAWNCGHFPEISIRLSPLVSRSSKMAIGERISVFRDDFSLSFLQIKADSFSYHGKDTSGIRRLAG